MAAIINTQEVRAWGLCQEGSSTGSLCVLFLLDSQVIITIKCCCLRDEFHSSLPKSATLALSIKEVCSLGFILEQPGSFKNTNIQVPPTKDSDLCGLVISLGTWISETNPGGSNAQLK